ncbi:MAG: response regulator transcription factor [Bacillota bacterium]|nr:response regulator transcription factor [Bacillota bacterium]
MKIQDSEAQAARILFLEDDPTIRAVLSEYMLVAGYEVTAVSRADEAVALLDGTDTFDLAILDIMVPGGSGLDVLGEIRHRRLPMGTIMLTALGDEPTQLDAFNRQADDYVVKPVSPLLLLKRMETILRRLRWARDPDAADAAATLAAPATAAAPAPAPAAAAPRLELDAEGWQARYDGRVLPLTVSEFLLLQTLMTQPQRVFTREQLILAIYDDSYAGNDRIIDSHVKNLRKKLPAPCIRTVIGVGYQFDGSAISAAAEP